MEIQLSFQTDSELLGAIHEVRRRLEEAFAADTAAPGFPGTVPSTGHCAAVSTIVHEVLGGDLVSAKVAGVSHWFNRLRSNGFDVDVDLTGDQFGFPEVQVATAGKLYAETRVRTFQHLNAETLWRARTLAARSGLHDVAMTIEKSLSDRVQTIKPSK